MSTALLIAWFVGGFCAVAGCGWAAERLSLEDGRWAKVGRVAVITLGVAIWAPWLLMFGSSCDPVRGC